MFAFTGYRWDAADSTAVFSYRLHDDLGPDLPGPHEFTESVSFAPGTAADPHDLDRILVLAGAVLGLSYYKASAPDTYRVDPPGLTPPAVRFLAAALRDGLAEFAYRNGLPGPLEPRIELATGPARPREPRLATERELRHPVVPVGGGKDSVVSVELLRRAGFVVTQLAVNPNSIINRVTAASGLPLLALQRVIDPRLLEANAAGARNGHVPVTAMNSLLAVAQAVLSGLGPVVMSNESSAAEETLVWNGFPVNHQWSKGPEAERLLADAIAGQLGRADSYFSLLRAFSELRIARTFAEIEGYDGLIVSCNRAYRLSGAAPSWCGECDKCRFVFLAFAPFMTPERVVGIVGRDLFADAANVEGYAALLGLNETKPFECVGEIRESQVAMSLALRLPHWRDSAVGRAVLERAPQLRDAAERFGDEVLGEAPAPRLPAGYGEARDAAL